MIKIVLLLVSMLPVMAGAIIAASLPLIAQQFAALPNALTLARLMLTLPALFVAFSGPVVGVLIDRLGSRPVLLFGLLVFTLAGTSGLWLSDPYLLLGGRGLLGIAVACIITASTVMIGDHFTGAARNSLMGLRGAFMALGGFLFVSVGGALSDFHWRAPFAVYVIAVLFLALSWAFLPTKVALETSEHKEEEAINPKSSLVNLILVASFFGMMMFYLVPVELPFFLRSRFGLSGTVIGLAIGVTTLFGALGSLLHKKLLKRLDFSTIQSLSFLLTALGYWGLQASTSKLMVVFALIPAGLGSGLMMPNFTLWIMTVTPAKLRGRYLGRLTFAIFMGQFAAPFLLIYSPEGWGHYSFAAVLLLVGSCCLFGLNRLSR